MNQPVRRKTDAGRNGRESPRHDRIILWKTLTKSSECPSTSTEEAYCSGASMSSRSSRHAGTAGLRTSSNKRCSKTPGKCRAIHKMKTRPGGQPDGSSHMGAWGGWALAPNTADGEGLTAPTLISRSSPAERSKRRSIFLLLVGAQSPPNHRAAARLASFAADLSDAIDGAASFSDL